MTSKIKLFLCLFFGNFCSEGKKLKNIRKNDEHEKKITRIRKLFDKSSKIYIHIFLSYCSHFFALFAPVFILLTFLARKTVESLTFVLLENAKNSFDN